MTQPLKILVVDDNPSARYLKGHILRRQGYTTLEAETGAEALALVATESPALVILDVNLRDMSGLDVCREIKAGFSQCLVLQTSAAFVDVSDRTHALEIGADSYLIEPIEPAELLASVRALLRIHSMENALRRMNDDLELVVAERTGALEEANRRLAGEIEERRRAEMILWQTQKIDLISRFSGGIAHDFNNLLTIISGNLELMRNAVGNGTPQATERILRMLSTAEAATANGAQITQRLLAFARRVPTEAVLTRISDLVAHWRPLLTQAVGEAIELDLTYDPDIWACMIDRSQLESAVVNLVVNAKDALPNGGTISIAATNRSIGGDYEATLEMPAGDYVQVAVSDDGVGMAGEILEHIFEPFFTTKSVGRGSGLGLSQVYGFVRQSSGYIEVTSTPGTGSTFVLLFPRAEGSVSDGRTTAAAGDHVGGDETILVVDDNQEVRDVTSAMVGSLGYRVVCASNASEALKIIEDRDGLDLVVTDVVMPGGVDGFELARRARSLRPSLPIVMVSGYTAQGPERSNAQNLTVLRKPYRSGELARHIRGALDQRTHGDPVS